MRMHYCQFKWPILWLLSLLILPPKFSLYLRMRCSHTRRQAPEDETGTSAKPASRIPAEPIFHSASRWRISFVLHIPRFGIVAVGPNSRLGRHAWRVATRTDRPNRVSSSFCHQRPQHHVHDNDQQIDGKVLGAQCGRGYLFLLWFQLRFPR